MKQNISMIFTVLFTAITIILTTNTVELEIRKLDYDTFADEDAYKKYLDETQKTLDTFEQQKKIWQEEQQQLIDDGKEKEAKDIEDKITSVNTVYAEIKSKLTIDTRENWEQDEWTVDDINESINKYNTETDAAEQLIEKIKKETEKVSKGIAEAPAQEKPEDIIEPQAEAGTPEEWQNYEKNILIPVIDGLREEIQTDWKKVTQDTSPEEAAKIQAEVFSKVDQLERTILAKLEATVPIAKIDDYQTHKTILENITQQIDYFDPTELQSKIDEIDNLEVNPPPEPQTALERDLGLSNKIPTDQMKAINEKLISVLNAQEISTLNDIATAMEHYGLNQSYSGAYETIKQSVDIYQKKEAQAPEVTPEEQAEQGLWQTAMDGIQSVSDAVWQTSASIIEGTTEAFKTVAEAGIGYLKFSAVDASDGIAYVTSQAADFIEDYYDDKVKTAETLDKAAGAMKVIEKIITYIPDFVIEKRVERGAPKGAEALEKLLEEKLAGLQKETYYVTTFWLGERAALLVDDRLNELSSYLKQQGADQKVIDVAQSFIKYTADYIQKNPSTLQTAAKTASLVANFFKAQAESGQSVVKRVRSVEQVVKRLSDFAQRQLDQDVAIARDLINSEREATFKPDSSTTFLGKLKTKISTWTQDIKKTISSIFDNSEQRLSSAKTNYTDARNALMKFLDIDPTTATEQTISDKIKAANRRVTNQKDTPYYRLYENKINDFLTAQDELAKVYANHKDQLNGVMTSFELTVKAWNDVGWTVNKAEAIYEQKPFAKDVIRLFDLRDAKIAHQSALQEGLKIIQDEVSAQKGSDFDPLNEKFINNISTMLNSEIVSTVNTFDTMITNVDNELSNLQRSLATGLSKVQGSA